MHRPIFYYGEELLTVSKALAIGRGQLKGVLSEEGRSKVNKSVSLVEKVVASGRVVYGINTGFGPLCTTLISEEDTSLLQENILKSHAVGVGKPISALLAKLMLVLKVHALAKGFSGIQQNTIDRLIWYIENDIIPIVPTQGSVGASGDLAPLSHLFLPLIGLGKVFYKGKERFSNDVLNELDISPISLAAKEGLALINGTQFIAAHAVEAVEQFHRVLMQGDLIAAIMLEGLNASIKPFLQELHELRPFPANQFVASTVFNLLNGSEIVASHANCSRVQDPYSLRCIPQVHGASRAAWLHLKELVEIEINSITDNPVLINEELTISGGNFHGQPLAIALDYACVAASEMGNIGDRRIYLSLEGDTANVPKLLVKATGLNSGFMILQYTTAALASENKGLCFPASADSIPTSLGQEDHVSMGPIGGRKLLQVLDNVEKIQSIELLCASQALDFHKPLRSTPVIEDVHRHVREHVPHIEEDQAMNMVMEAVQRMVTEGELLSVARSAAKKYDVPYLAADAELYDKF